MSGELPPRARFFFIFFLLIVMPHLGTSPIFPKQPQRQDWTLCGQCAPEDIKLCLGFFSSVHDNTTENLTATNTDKSKVMNEVLLLACLKDSKKPVNSFLNASKQEKKSTFE